VYSRLTTKRLIKGWHRKCPSDLKKNTSVKSKETVSRTIRITANGFGRSDNVISGFPIVLFEKPNSSNNSVTMT